MEIRFATKEMIPQIKEIWHQCFGDEEDYMEFYLPTGLRKKICWCVWKIRNLWQ